MTAPRGRGFWERAKLAAMRDIQQVAVDLFERHGFHAVTVEQVAKAAGVSASSIYRYFDAKEMLVLWDEYDPQIIELVRTAGAGPQSIGQLMDILESAGAGLAAAILAAGDEERIKRRMRLVNTVPDIRAGQQRLVEEFEVELRDVLAERLGLEPGSLALRIASAQACWGFQAAIDYWVAGEFSEPLGDVLADALSRVARGLRAQFD
ncbi:MAG: TetR family transcriptional regulator [Mycobacteriaceae bacterium]|nr:TetR family transcriptional regulator [Mycobacteriaceae bacterium]